MLTSHNFCVNIVFAGHKSDCAKKLRAGVAQLAEQLICNQQVAGSSPITSSNFFKVNTGGYPSGQRGQTVNLLRLASMVRIHLPPPAKRHFSLWKNVFFHLYKFLEEFAIYTAYSIYLRFDMLPCGNEQRNLYHTVT